MKKLVGSKVCKFHLSHIALCCCLSSKHSGQHTWGHPRLTSPTALQCRLGWERIGIWLNWVLTLISQSPNNLSSIAYWLHGAGWEKSKVAWKRQKHLKIGLKFVIWWTWVSREVVYGRRISTLGILILAFKVLPSYNSNSCLTQSRLSHQERPCGLLELS